MKGNILVQKAGLSPSRIFGWFRNTFKRRPLLQTSAPASYECGKLQLNGTCVIQICLSLWVHPTPPWTDWVGTKLGTADKLTLEQSDEEKLLIA